MQWKSLAVALALSAHQAHAVPAQDITERQSSSYSRADMMRFSCSQLVFDRIDPLVEPGNTPSAHLHQIVGGNSFNVTMEPGVYDPSKVSTCTTCQFAEDFSNYWTANMFYKAKNGSFKRVPQMPNLGFDSANGGVTVYYIPPYDGKTKVTAFKAGFRMLVGDSSLRSGINQQKQLCHRCSTNLQQNPFGGAPCADKQMDSFELPKKQCKGGIRTTITFPTCWDGKNTDSPNHKDHVAYPSSGTFENTGPCPATHPVRLPQLMYEVMWDTTQFNTKELWPEDSSQPFVYSMGDGTGFGQHGDYLFGWKGDALQKALDSRCSGPSCKVLTSQSIKDTNKCSKGQSMKEETEGWLPQLPGGMKVTYS